MCVCMGVKTTREKGGGCRHKYQNRRERREKWTVRDKNRDGDKRQKQIHRDGERQKWRDRHREKDRDKGRQTDRQNTEGDRNQEKKK